MKAGKAFRHGTERLWGNLTLADRSPTAGVFIVAAGSGEGKSHLLSHLIKAEFWRMDVLWICDEDDLEATKREVAAKRVGHRVEVLAYGEFDPATEFDGRRDAVVILDDLFVSRGLPGFKQRSDYLRLVDRLARRNGLAIFVVCQTFAGDQIPDTFLKHADYLVLGKRPSAWAAWLDRFLHVGKAKAEKVLDSLRGWEDYNFALVRKADGFMTVPDNHSVGGWIGCAARGEPLSAPRYEVPKGAEGGGGAINNKRGFLKARAYERFDQGDSAQALYEEGFHDNLSTLRVYHSLWKREGTRPEIVAKARKGGDDG